jgi:tripeptide aminopeptidase
MVNRNRLCAEFQQQAAIDSPSYKEAAMAAYLRKRLEKLGAAVEFDAAGEAVGSDSGNLIARIPGSKAGPAFLLSVHMDTVTPATGVQPQLHEGVFTSAGKTILGADDKAGICEIIEAIEVLKEQQIAHVPLEVVITICEEKGLLGAKQLDMAQLQSKRGVALDTAGVDLIINRAPAANRFKIDVVGLEAHAGICPEQGISAIAIAGAAIARLPLGRIDAETTANIGTIHGGEATNVVPNRVTLSGEVRSLDAEKLRQQTKLIVSVFEQEVDRAKILERGGRNQASMVLELNEDFPAFQVAETAKMVKLVQSAGTALGRPQQLKAAGGGSDANIFNARGIETLVLATGMDKIHTVDEQISVDDMVKVSELLVEILRQA